MEYGKIINSDNNIYENITRNVGNDYSKDFNLYFNDDNIKYISQNVIFLLKNVHPSGKPIVVPDHIILNVMDSVYQNCRPITGDIYSRYNVNNNISMSQNIISNMIKEVIEIIVLDVKYNIEKEINNNKLNIWTTVLGDFNNDGLRSHAPIKIRKKKINRGFISFMK
jgi:hypothetical protein